MGVICPSPSTVLQRALLVLVACSAWTYGDAGIRDDAGLFSRDAAASAQSTIQEIQRQFAAEVLIETMDRAPARCAATLQQQGAERFFTKWASKRAVRTNGIYVLAVREPAVVVVRLGRSAEGWNLTDEQAGELREMIAGATRKGDFDQGLSNGVAYAQRTIAQRWVAGRPPAQAGVGHWSFGLAIGAALSAMGLWGITRGETVRR